MMIAILFVLLAGVILFYAGPKVEVDTTLRPVDLPKDLEKYLRESEANLPDIRPDNEKTIIWAGEPGQKTPLSIVYLHGFSASRQEMAPLSDNVAAKLGANLYYPRMTGHGRSPEAMGETTVNTWINDSYEAFSIARRLGEKVIVIGASLGGTAAAWLATQPESKDVLAFVLISPNFGIQKRFGEFLTLPWGEQMVRMVMGPTRGWTSTNEEASKYWTNHYPSKTMLTVVAFIQLVRKTELEAVKQPVLTIYSPNDKVVNPAITERIFARFGSANKKLIPIEESQHNDHHVLAGDVMAPDDTAKVEKMILDFLSSLLDLNQED